MTQARTPSPVDAVADGYLDAVAALDPLSATEWGIPGHDDRMPDLTPDWHASMSQLRTRTLAELADAEAAAADQREKPDPTDRVTAKALRDHLELHEHLRAAGDDLAKLNILASPAQGVRDIFDLMPTTTADDWTVIARRLAAVPTALAGYTASLRESAARGLVRSRRQVEGAARGCTGNTGSDGFFAAFARSAPVDLPDALRADLETGASAAAEAYAELGRFLLEDLLPQAPTRDAFGRDEYALHSFAFLGTAVDLDEAYAWGQDELARIRTEMAATAERITPGGSVADAIGALDADPRRQLEGTAALRDWMQETSDRALAELAESHFDIPAIARRLDCRIAPTQTGGVYYTAPSEDLTTRPGTMWWSVPAGPTSFTTWQTTSVVYHEGVPGHHLQVTAALLSSQGLNRWRRVGSWVSGHGEGWALYAERLMDELGYLEDVGDRLGWLDCASLRAARVVIDIGMHCELPAPASVGGGTWTWDKAWAYLTAASSWDHRQLDFELNRYYGWPGQAPSYKLGERFWLALRDDAAAAAGDAFSLREFHRRALDVGSVGLDALRLALV